MKKFSLLLIVVITAIDISAQGSFKVLPGATIKTINGAHVVLNNMNLLNNGTIQQGSNDGTFDFRGNTNTAISGTGISMFNRIHLAQNVGSLLTLQRNILVGEEFVFAGGLLNLENYILYLGSQGVLTNESELSRVYTTGTGYIEATGVLNNPSSINLGNLGAVISSTKNFGSTIIRRGHAVQQNVAGSNSSILRNFDIIPENNTSLSATLKFYYFDAELNGINEATLIQWKKNNGNNWVHVGADTKDPVINYVLRDNISKFSLWTLATEQGNPANNFVNKYEVVESYQDKFMMKALPNPSIQSFAITIQSPDQQSPIYLKIINISGQTIETRNALTPGQTLKIGENYRPGIYFIEAIQGKNHKLIKLVKQ